MQKKQRVVQIVSLQLGFVPPVYQVGMAIPISAILHVQVGLIEMEISALLAQISMRIARNVTVQQTVLNVPEENFPKRVNVFYHAQEDISKILIISAAV